MEKLKIRTGTAVRREDGRGYHWVDIDTEDGGTTAIDANEDEFAEAHATLYADAHNTYNSCHTLPSGLYEALEKAYDFIRLIAKDDHGRTVVSKRKMAKDFLAAISKHKNSNLLRNEKPSSERLRANSQ